MGPAARLLSDLVAIPSVNPMGRPLSGPEFLEGRMTDYLEGHFRERGITATRTTVAPGRDNVLARYESPGSARTLLFDAHQDTVPTDGMTIAPFEPRIEGGKLYGRGSCDIKGGLAAMLLAFERLHRERPKGSASVVLACTVDEEFTHLGASRLVADRVRADLAIVAEPTLLDLVVTHKGAVRWKVRTKGVACHSSRPELGDNAIYRMARVIGALSEYACALSGREPLPLLGPPSFSVGRIEGGQSVNIVPDWCEIEVDRRVNPGEVGLELPGEALTFVRERLGGLDGVEFLPPWLNMPALAPRVDDAVLGGLKGAITRVIGREPALGGVPFGTDAGPLGHSGMPCVVFGPGDIAQAHTKDEWVDLGQVEQAAEAYYQMACALG